MENKIHFILTGGTIDGSYDPIHQTARPGIESVIPAYFEEAIKPYMDLSFEQICMKDSNDINDGDRADMATAIKNAPVDKVILTHGTDTMENTAEFLIDALGETDKTIIITGSIVPLAFSGSDSGFNLGFAVAKIAELTAGTYICMHAKIFEAGNFTKNFDTARFEEK